MHGRRRTGGITLGGLYVSGVMPKLRSPDHTDVYYIKAYTHKTFCNCEHRTNHPLSVTPQQIMCMCVRVHIFIQVYAYAHARICIRMSEYVYTHACICIRMQEYFFLYQGVYSYIRHVYLGHRIYNEYRFLERKLFITVLLKILRRRRERRHI